MQALFRLLKENPGYARLWSAQVVSLTGDWFNTIVLSALVVDYSDGSGLAVSLFLLARFLPPLLIGPVAGVLVDRFDRKRILVASNFARVFIVLGFLLASEPDRLWIIYALTIAQFSISAFFEPGQSAITPSLVRRRDLIQANTLASITWSVMLAMGAIAGGIVSALFGAPVALIIDAVTFAVAGWLISTIDDSKVVEEAVADATSTGAMPPVPAVPTDEGRSFRDGLRYLRQHPGTVAVMLVKGGGSIGNTDTLLTIYGTQIFVIGNEGQLSLGILYSAFGLGAMFGPLLLNRINDGSVRRMRRLLTIGFFWAAFGWVVMGVAGSIVVASLALLIRAMGGSANWTYSSVIIQKTVPDNYLGRVFSLDLAAFQLATVVSTIVHGALLDTLGTDYIEAIVFGTAFVSALPLFMWLWALVRMERREEARELAASTTS